MHKIFEIITEIVGLVQIMLSPTMIGIALGFTAYYYFIDPVGIIVGILIIITGLTIGLIWATNKFKTIGTIHFMSRISATPELDNVEKSDKKDKI